MELCGGIHVKNTGEIWYFKIVSEGAVAAGIRRIKRLWFKSRVFTSQENALNEIKLALKNPQDVIKAVVSVQRECKIKKTGRAIN
jgi:alanyl-tRNA synthetase